MITQLHYAYPGDQVALAHVQEQSDFVPLAGVTARAAMCSRFDLEKRARCLVEASLECAWAAVGESHGYRYRICAG